MRIPCVFYLNLKQEAKYQAHALEKRRLLTRLEYLFIDPVDMGDFMN